MSDNIDYAVVGATQEEISYICSYLKNPEEIKTRYLNPTVGDISGKKVLVTTCGIGITNASICGTALFENFDVGTLVSVGIAGAYDGTGIKKGDVAVAEEEVYADMGVWYEGSIDLLDKIGIPLFTSGKKNYFNRWPVTSPLLITVRELIANSPKMNDFSIYFGAFATVAAVSGSLARAAELRKIHDVLCENMEGAALAQVATIYGAKFFECRGISNIAGIRDKKEWKVDEAIRNVQRFLIQLLRSCWIFYERKWFAHIWFLSLSE